jgi:hypothetical protein
MKKTFRPLSILVAMMFLFVMLSVTTDAFAAYSVKQVISRFSAVAAETLITGNVVMLKTDGLAYKADADDAALRPAVGVIGKGGTTGQTVEIITIGVLSGWSSLTEGGTGYLSETAAAVTQTEPGYSQKIASAISTTTYMFNFAAHPALGYYNAGTTSASANTNKRATGLFYSGSVAVSSGTSVVVSGFSPAFTTTSTYNCLVTAQAPTPLTGVAWKCAKTSVSSITISTTTSNAVSDTIDYIVVGY